MRKRWLYVLVTHVTVIALVVAPSMTIGANKTWDGGGDGTNWDSGANWDPDGEPTGADFSDTLNSNAVGGNLNVVIDGINASIGPLGIGDWDPAQSTTLTVQGGGNLTVGGSLNISRIQENSTVRLAPDAGTVQASEVNMGFWANPAGGANALVHVEGGLFDATWFNIGAAADDTHPILAHVQQDGGTITVRNAYSFTRDGHTAANGTWDITGGSVHMNTGFNPGLPAAFEGDVNSGKITVNGQPTTIAQSFIVTPGNTINGVTGTTYTLIPEPASLALIGLGLVGLGFLARRRK